ncbi:MAG: PAS domain-containing protein [Acidobacteria bacterium]|nr:PAS domain-containing protein [Acidobacteriota bacterium]
MRAAVPLQAADILDALAAQAAVVSEDGTIVAVNQSWTDFCVSNGGDSSRAGVGINYFGVCGAEDVAHTIRQVLSGDVPVAESEYRCDSPTEERWFTLQVTPCRFGDERAVLVLHTNITFRRKRQRELQEVADAERRDWEMASLAKLTAPAAAHRTGASFGVAPVASALPDLVAEATGTYIELVKSAFDARVYRRNLKQSDEIRQLATALGRLGASPRELVGMHCEALRHLMHNVPLAKAGVYQEEGRMILLEAMGYLATHYRMSSTMSRGRALACEQ